MSTVSPDRSTDELAERLAMGAGAVQRLPSPYRRAALWLAMSLPIVGVVVGVHYAFSAAVARIGGLLAVEEAAILLTTATAAVAAFSSTVPGRDWRMSLLPVAPLVVWLATLGESCTQEWLATGSDGVRLYDGPNCALGAIAISALPTIAMVAMLRRGAPLAPRLTIVLGALAVAALVNAGLRLFHAGDVSFMVLIWHVGVAFALALSASTLGRRALNWRSAILNSDAAPLTSSARR